MTILKTLSALAHALLLIVIILMILTGYGITDYHAVERITLGVLTKPLSYQLHTALILPLIFLLAVHILLVLLKRYTPTKQ